MHMLTPILVALNLLTAYLTFRTAERRGRSIRAWTWFGLLFGPLAWLTVALLPAQPART